MKPFTKYEGTIVPIMNDNIDTDQLIPKQYLKSIEKTGLNIVVELIDPCQCCHSLLERLFLHIL